MKSIKLVVLSTFITLAVFGGVLYTSCTKDSCKAVTCLNGCVCGSGICGNPPKGIGGLNCEIVYRLLYANTYTGYGRDDSSQNYFNNTFTFTALMDSNYSNMQVSWTNPGSPHSITMPVVLTNNSANGSNFTLGPTTVGTYVYQGTGFISSAVASITLNETDSGSHPVVITFSTLNKQ